MAIMSKKTTRTVGTVSIELAGAIARKQGIEKSVTEITTHLLSAIQAQDTVTEQIMDLVLERRALVSEAMGARQ